MEYLLLIVCTILAYTDILPTLSLFFELIRTYLTAKIAIIQQNTVHIQEDIVATQEKMEPTKTHVIGFNTSDTEIIEDEDYE